MSDDQQFDLAMTPIGFTQIVLGMDLYPWQDKVLAAFEGCTGRKDSKQVRVALKSPNGAGKSSHIVAPVSLWFLATHRRGKVVITTKDRKQLYEQIWPAITRHKEKFSSWDWKESPYIRITTSTGGVLIAFTTDEAERVEGHHKHDNIIEPLLMVADEAKGIDDKIFQGIDRCTFNALLYASSPGLTRGRFWRAFHADRAMWKCFEASMTDCPHKDQQQIDYVIKTHGEDHPFTRSTIYGEFMSQEDLEKYCVSDLAMDFSMSNPPKHRPGLRMMFCDFAGAGAENVVAFRDGNKIEIAAAFKEANKMASCSRFLQVFKRYGMKANDVVGDAADKEMCDLLSEAGWHIRRQNFGAPAFDDQIYMSWGAEAWIEAGIGIAKNEWILPDDDELRGQLTSRRRTWGRAGKFGVEDKYDMRRKRDLPSPDRADAVVGVMHQREFAVPPELKSIYDFKEDQEGMQSSKFLDTIGANAGWG